MALAALLGASLGVIGGVAVGLMSLPPLCVCTFEARSCHVLSSLCGQDHEVSCRLARDCLGGRKRRKHLGNLI